MTTIRTLNHTRTPLLGLMAELSNTAFELEAEPVAAEHAPAFLILREKTEAVLSEELAIEDKIIQARVRLNVCYRNFDTFASLVSKTLLTIVADNRAHSLYITYFGDRSLSQFRRLRQSEKLAVIRGWATLLAGSQHASLKDLMSELEPLLKVANDAIAAKDLALSERKLFREEGARKKIFDEVNVTRKSKHGEIAKLPHLYTGLPSDFADRFFLQESSKPEEEEEEEEPSADVVRAAIKELKAKLAAEEERLKKIEADEAKAAAKEADKAALAALEKAIAEQTAKANELKAKIEASS